MRKPGTRDAWLALKLYELRQDGVLAEARDMLSDLVATRNPIAWNHFMATFRLHPNSNVSKEVTLIARAMRDSVRAGLTCSEALRRESLVRRGAQMSAALGTHRMNGNCRDGDERTHIHVGEQGKVGRVLRGHIHHGRD